MRRSALESLRMKFFEKEIFMMTRPILPHLLRIYSVIEEGFVTQNVAKTKRKNGKQKISKNAILKMIKLLKNDDIQVLNTPKHSCSAGENHMLIYCMVVEISNFC